MNAERARRQGLCVVVTMLAACSHADAKPARVAQVPPLLATCPAAGAMECGRVAAAADPDALCSALSNCLMDRVNEIGAVTQIAGCEPHTFADPAPTNVPETVAVFALYHVEVENDFPTPSASFLFARGAEGWCPVAYLLPPAQYSHGCSASFQRSWQVSEASGAPHLRIWADETCLVEPEEDDPDSALRSCVASEFELRNGRMTRLRARRTDGPCAKLTASP